MNKPPKGAIWSCPCGAWSKIMPVSHECDLTDKMKAEIEVERLWPFIKKKMKE
jgi:hypothetical protein